MDMYFLIDMGEDGLEIQPFDDSEKLLKEFTGAEQIEFLSSIPDSRWDWGDGRLIIKGKIVRPTPVRIVTEYDID